MGEQTIAIAIDGPAAAGKSTVAKIVADKLKFIYIDTGAMYRALTLKIIQEGIELTEEASILNILLETTIELRNNGYIQQVLLDDVDVSEEIRKDAVSTKVSHVAKLANIRHEMVKRQQALANERSVVMDGRDIGTHVLPQADLKFFLVASAEERGKRRFEENQQRGIPSDYDQLVNEIKERDEIDTNRAASPLVKATDAIELDTTHISINEVVEKILAEVAKITKV